MSDNGSKNRPEKSFKKATLTVVTVILIGLVAGLGVAIGYRKIPRHWFRPGSVGTSQQNQAEPLFYTTIGDSTLDETATTAPQNNNGKLPTTKYTIEIGVLDSREEAEGMVRELAAAGVDAFFTPLLKDGRVIFRVRHGIFDSEASAKSAAKSISSRHKLKATVGEM